ncbi:MAG: histidine--tRNA ligase [Candidatus Aenigmatarchaeota archaeon]|nr:MAG: histidine--tRNA ligase [Candidatus Aenigmarchaeota archaeon]
MTQSPKGTQDFGPKEAMARGEMIGALRQVFQLYGFEPLETTSLQNFEVLSSKYTGGAEILKETYKLEDQGGRKLGLRYDLTVPLVRFMAENRSLAKPFKRYEIGKVWRDGPLKAGRYREFMQVDADVIGVTSVAAEAELLAMAQTFFKALGIDAVIKYNNRKVLNGLLKKFSIPEREWNGVLQSMDKLEKMGRAYVEKELTEKGVDKGVAKDVVEIIAKTKDLELLTGVIDNDVGRKGIEELLALQEYLVYLGVDTAEWDLSLSRGLDYYTGTVFEAFFTGGKVTSSIAGGGRYDKMIGALIGSKEDVPAVGISFGLDAILDGFALERERTITRVLVVPINALDYALTVAQAIRAWNVNTEVDMMNRNLSKNLDYANKKGIARVIIVGEKEKKEQTVTYKDMESGKQETDTLEKLKKRIVS